MSITGEPGGPPVKAGVPLTDLGAGLFALVGILAALEHRHRTGVGQQVDTSLVDAGVALSVWEATEYFSGDRRAGGARLRAPDERAVSGDPLRRRLHHARRRQRAAVPAAVRRARPPGMDRRCRSSPTTRAACSNRERAGGADRGDHRQQPRAHWLALLEANDIPCGPINDYAQVFADPQVRRARDGGRNRSSDARAAAGRSARRSR